MQSDNIMEHSKDRELYLKRRAKQLHQWERVIDKLILRADKAKEGGHTALRHYIIKIQVKKARTEVKLRQLHEAGNGKWDDLKASLEKSCAELRETFLKASAKPE